MQEPQLLTIGESMVLITPTTAEPLQSATEFVLDAAGAESNVASHCAYLGISTTWVSAVGDDPLGRRLIDTITTRGVDTSHVRINGDAFTGVFFKDPGEAVHYYRTGSAASLMDPSILQGLPLAGAQILHLSGITQALSASCAHLVNAAIDLARTTGVTVSFDVNYRGALWPLPVAAPALLATARQCDIVFVGLDEALTLWGCTTPQEIHDLLPEATLVVKDSDVGATEFTGSDPVFVPAHEVDVVEAVGAGDAFAAGYLAAWLNGATAIERLRSGHDQAALVLGSTSDYLMNEDDNDQF